MTDTASLQVSNCISTLLAVKSVSVSSHPSSPWSLTKKRQRLMMVLHYRISFSRMIHSLSPSTHAISWSPMNLITHLARQIRHHRLLPALNPCHPSSRILPRLSLQLQWHAPDELEYVPTVQGEHADAPAVAREQEHSRLNLRPLQFQRYPSVFDD